MIECQNAIKGINKLTVAQIISLVTTVVSFIGIGVVFFGVTSVDEGLSKPMNLAMAFVALSAIIAEVYLIIGLCQLRKDEPIFATKALVVLIVSIILTIVVAIFAKVFMSEGSVVKLITQLIMQLMSIAVFGLTVYSVMDLMGDCHDFGVYDLGSTILKVYAGAFALSFIALIMAGFFGQVINLVAFTFHFIVVVLMVVFLMRAKNVLIGQIPKKKNPQKPAVTNYA